MNETHTQQWVSQNIQYLTDPYHLAILTNKIAPFLFPILTGVLFLSIFFRLRGLNFTYIECGLFSSVFTMIVAYFLHLLNLLDLTWFYLYILIFVICFAKIIELKIRTNS